MTEDAFRKLVEEAIDSIPERFAKQVRNVGFVIEEEPSDQLLDEMEVEPGDTLFGLYQGTPLTERGTSYGNTLPDRITLFQRPIEEASDGSDDAVFVEIAKTLIHELGHYFGLDEDQIDVIEEMWERDNLMFDEGDENA